MCCKVPLLSMTLGKSLTFTQQPVLEDTNLPRSRAQSLYSSLTLTVLSASTAQRGYCSTLPYIRFMNC